ncbi:MAG: proton-conducting transporter membrane subunit, partial [Anaerolineales bacterium]|nr:proton-conducting transporter membrane subunit [Anaerolineales bacterium]
LFLSAGSVILGLERGHHYLAHHGHGGHGSPSIQKEQDELPRSSHEEVFDPCDMRNMGGLRKTMPVTFWLYLIGTLALAGIFPLAGFWSKDEILTDAQLHYPTVYILLTIAAFFTAFYMGRQIWMVFFGKARHDAAAHAEESKPIITAPLMVLAGLSILGGALNLPYLHTFTHWLGYTLGGEGAESAAHAAEVTPWYVLGGLNLAVAGLSTVLALAAIYFSWLIYGRKPLAAGQKDPLKKALGFIFTGMERKWFVDEIYWAAFVDRYVDISRFLADVIDGRFWHDWFHDKVLAGTYNWLSRIALDKVIDTRGIDAFFNGLGELTKQASASLRRLQNGFVRSYALAVLFGVVAILGYLLIR